MRSATTWILLAAAIGLGIGIYLGDSQQGPDQENQGGKILSRFQPETVGEIRIESQGVETLITRRGDLWYIDKPVVDRADQMTIAAVLDLLSHLTIRDKITTEEIKSDDNLSNEKLGFSTDDRVLVSLKTNFEAKNKKASGSGDTITMTFGKEAPMTNTIFARHGSDKNKTAAAYIVDGNPRKYFENPAAALRDQKLLFAPVERLAGLTMKTARDMVKVERKPTAPAAGWLMTHPLPARANAELIESIIAQLSSLRVESMLDDNASTGAIPNPVPEDGVVYELHILGMQKPVSLFLSPAKDASTENADKDAAPLVVARTSDRPASFLVRSSLLDKIPTSPNAFRDPYLARIPTQRLHSIFIQTRDNPDVVLTTRPSSTGQLEWRSDRNGKRELANREKIGSLIDAVNSEKVQGFVADPEADPALFGLDHPFTAITFNIFQPVPQTPGSQPDNTQKAKMVQRTLKLGFSSETTNDLFASFEGEPYIYQISPTFRNHVSPHPLKWKSPKVINFSLLSLRSIERNKKGKESQQLDYDYKRDQWSGKEGNEDLKGQIDYRTAQKLSSTLGSLQAQDWITTSQAAYQALNDPEVTFRIVIEEIDQALQEPRNASHSLRFAKTSSSGFYYGSIDGSPDVFIIDRETFRDLIQPIRGAPGTLPPVQ